MSDRATGGDIVAAFLETAGVTHAFGVISIHNMPILDAIARRDRIRFVPSRGEAGAVAMADAHARVADRLSLAVTSTGTGAGNACGALVEAQSAGTPLLHVTGQIESEHLDRDRSISHEAKDQLGMLRAVSKAAFRVWSPETLLGTLKEAVRAALTSPRGPVSIEIPIDVQEAEMDWPADLLLLPIAAPPFSAASLDALGDRLATARRPLLWLGGGARHAGAAVARLAALGFGAVTSVNGRGILPEDHPQSLGALNQQPASETFYATCDAMLAVGTRFRASQTKHHKLGLPRPLYQIDVDPRADGRNYHADLFLCADAALALDGLADRLAGRMQIDPAFSADLAAARQGSAATLRSALGPYGEIFGAIEAAVPRDFVWVRDTTLANSMWGNRFPRLARPQNGVYALGGAIGLGLPMAIGAALAAEGRKTVAIVGDGGLALTLGELATLVQEKLDIVLILMNDGGYGVIRNILDARFGGRRNFVELHTPDHGKIAGSIGLAYRRVGAASEMAPALAAALGTPRPTLLEVDMKSVGPFAKRFAGPRAG